MKTTKNSIVVFLIILATHLSSYAQYNGGDSSGSFSEELSITSCGIPAHFNAYFGGFNDGATNDELSNTACGFPPSFFAYLGGTDDGATVDELSATICGFPPSFYAYFGGTDDGAATDEIFIGICPFPPSFYAYFGGFDDGFVVDITVPICPTAAPVASFTASATEICVGQAVTFTDTSINIPSGWTWTFTGGTPSSSSVQNPVITYNTPGSYAVTLLVANFNGTDTQTISGYITVTAFPTITATTPASRCGTGTVTLGATASAGTLSWYANPTGGIAIGTGTSFTTPSITTTTTYYVETVNGVCSSARTLVNATVNTIPIIISTTPNSRCGTGFVQLSATGSVGNLEWFANATGGSPIAFGTSYTTPNTLSFTRDYYVEAVNGTCRSGRVAVTATINPAAAITGTTPSFACDSGAVTLGAATDAGTLNWYNASTGGTILGTGTSFTTPSLLISTIFYVEAVNGTCVSARTAVTASVYPTPLVTAVSQVTPICTSGSTTLSASSNYNGTNTWAWYDSASGGNLLATTPTYLTPVISVDTTYYVATDRFGCTSLRTAITAAVTPLPTVTSVLPASRCGTGSVTLSATASAGTISWWNAPTAGANVGTGPTYNTAIISATTTYYVQTTNNSCTSTRTEVIATIDSAQTITSTTPASRCDAGTVTLSAAATGGTLNWYADAFGGSILATGSNFTTPSISSSTTYYAEVTNETCTSARTAVTASITSVNAPTGNANQSFCNGETVGLLVTTSGSNIVWYNAASTGVVIPNSTPLVSGAIYYASQNNGTCESTSRLAVTATLGNCLGIDEVTFSQIKVYPNPVTDMLTISNTEMMSGIMVADMLGRILSTRNVNDTETQIDMSNYPTGTYLVEVTVDGAVKTFKVMKR